MNMKTVLAPIAWGTTYITVTELFPPERPLFVATTRVLPAGLALLGAAAIAARRRGQTHGAGITRPRGPDWRRCALLALFNFGLFFPLLAVAVYRLPGGVAAAVGGLQPLLVTGLSWPLAGRRPRARETAIGVLAVLGVALVVLRPGAGFDPVGVLAAVAANISFAAGVVLAKRYPAPGSRLAWTGWQLLLSGVFLLPLTLVAEGLPSVVPARTWVGVGYLSLVATALAFVVWFHGIARLPVVAPPLLGLAAPATGALLGWVVLGQSLSPLQLVGFAITLAAISYGALLPQPAPRLASHDEGGTRGSRPPATPGYGPRMATCASKAPLSMAPGCPG
jgi:probable blue pigment (indigoidine) exporter